MQDKRLIPSLLVKRVTMKKFLVVFIFLFVGVVAYATTYECHQDFNVDFSDQLTEMTMIGCRVHFGNYGDEKGLSECIDTGLANVEFYRKHIKAGTFTYNNNYFHKNGCYPDPIGSIHQMCMKLESTANRNECFRHALGQMVHWDPWNAKVKKAIEVNKKCSLLDIHSEKGLKCYSEGLKPEQIKYGLHINQQKKS